MALEFLVAATTVLVVSPVVIVLLRRRGLVDAPNARSSHVVATPRAGGITVALALLVTTRLATSLSGDAAAALMVGTAGFAAIGLADDLRPRSVGVRLAWQGVVACAVLPWLLQDMTSRVVWQLVFALGVWLWLIAEVNAFNFMDGIDGIAAAQAIVAGSVWSGVGLHQGADDFATGGVILAGAATGFLPYNFPRPRVFLGDVGSYGVGAWAAVLVVLGVRAGLPPVMVLAPVSVCLADTSTTLVRRIARHERWYEAHRTHAYQRLVAAGWDHATATGFVALATGLCSALGLLAFLGSWQQMAAAALIAVVLLGYLAAPALVERSGGRVTPRGDIIPE